MKKQMKTAGIGFYIIILAIIFVAVYASGVLSNSSSGSYNINTFKEDLEGGKVQSVEILPNQETPTGEISIVLTGGTSVSFYVSDVKEVEELLENNSVLYLHLIHRNLLAGIKYMIYKRHHGLLLHCFHMGLG